MKSCVRTFDWSCYVVFTLSECLLVFLLCDVQVVDVCGVVLAVVQLHDLRTDVRLQGSIVVGQVRERVLLPRCGYLIDSLAQAGCAPVTQNTSTASEHKQLSLSL